MSNDKITRKKERNKRLFGDKERSKERLYQLIKEVVSIRVVKYIPCNFVVNFM